MQSDDEDWDEGVEGMGRRPEKKLRIEDVTEDAIVREALKQEELEKIQKKSKPKGKPDGKTLHELEAEEGGPVKESMVKTALSKRALDRKRRQELGDEAMVPEEDIELPDEVTAYEVDEVQEEQKGEAGIRIIPFSFKDDREAGGFDEEGNFVEKKPEKGERDAWLDSSEAKVVSDKVREAVEARQRAMRAADQEEERKMAAPMTDRQIATLKVELARSMLPSESVSAAMKRVRGSGGGGGVKVKREARREAGGSGGNMELFLRMTEIVDLLFSEGETEIYTCDKEELEKSASMWLPKASLAAALSQAGKRARDDDDDDDDMFGEANEKAKEKTNVKEEGPPSKQGGPIPALDTSADDDAGYTGGTDFSSWPVKEIARFLKENGVADTSGIVEKGELVNLARTTERRIKKESEEARRSSQLNSGTPNAPPPGFVLHPESGFFHNAETSMYFDASSGCFWDGQRWLAFDGKAYVPLKS